MSYLDDLSAIWESVKLSFLDHYAKAIVDLWFGELKVHSYEDNVITLSIESEFKYKILTEKYLTSIRDGFTEQLGFEPEIKILFSGSPTSSEQIMDRLSSEAPAFSEKKEASDERPAGILPQNYKFEYTFENFIVPR